MPPGVSWAPAAKVVTETIWHHTQTAKSHRDGSVTLCFQVDGLNEILHWILSWAGRVQIQKPVELQKLFVQALHDAIQWQSAAAAYEKDRTERIKNSSPIDPN